MTTVFLSSTGRDLTAYREAVYAAIEGIDGYHCVRMEDFGARDQGAAEFDHAAVSGCDVFVGVLGHTYGAIPAGSETSYAEREHDEAIAAGIPRLMFLAPEDFPMPPGLVEADEYRARQRAFRNRVSRESIREAFSTPDDLSRRVTRALHNWEQSRLRTVRATVCDPRRSVLLLHVLVPLLSVLVAAAIALAIWARAPMSALWVSAAVLAALLVWFWEWYEEGRVRWSGILFAVAAAAILSGVLLFRTCRQYRPR